MSTLMYKDKAYSGTTTATDATHVTVDNGTGGTKTAQQMLANKVLFFENVPAASVTNGYIVNLNDDRITTDHVLVGGVNWGDSSKITALSTWSTDVAGYFRVTGTSSASTTATFTLIKKDN